MIATKPPAKGAALALKYGFLCALLLLLSAAIYTTTLIMEHKATLRGASRYNLTWLVSQASNEVLRFETAAAKALVQNGDVGKAEVELRLEIVEGRVRMFDEGTITEFLETSAQVRMLTERFRDTVSEMRRIFDEGYSKDGLKQLIMVSSKLSPSMAILAAQASNFGAEMSADDERRLSTMHWTVAGILTAIIVCGLGLFLALAWSRRQLDSSRWHNIKLRAQDIELKKRNERFNAALDNMSQGLCMIDAYQNLIICNASFLKLFGLSWSSARQGKSAYEIFTAAAMTGQYKPQMINSLANTLSEDRRGRTTFTVCDGTADGRAIAVSQEALEQGGWVATFEDVTERRQIDAYNIHMAHHDSLTGLPNRAMLGFKMAEALDRYGQGGQTVCLLLLDLDRFKAVNDTLGHPIGDALLREVTLRLRDCVHEQDVVARLGGDEFAILHTAQDLLASATTLASRIVEEVSRPYEIAGHRVSIGTSIGIAIAEAAVGTDDMLLRTADIALYRAKAEGRGTFRVFEKSMEEEMQERKLIEDDLREALSRGQISVHYQPIFDLAAATISGYEALLRWQHPVRGEIPPKVFIPIAEELGLITAIGRWALTRACTDATAWPDRMKVAVNVSSAQFRNADLVPAIRDALATAGLPAHRLDLEITESALLEDSERVLDILHKLSALGLRIALDDFGTGYSSLSYLHSFPFDKLKIDQSFVAGMASQPNCEAIVRSITSLAKTLGMSTTAEGVETEAQLAHLREIGCDEAQGYLFAEPRPAKEIAHTSISFEEMAVRTNVLLPSDAG